MIDTLQKIYIDFETYFNTKDGYTLKKTKKSNLSMVEYVRDSRFKVHGLGVAIDDLPTQWLSYKDIDKWKEEIDWSSAVVIAHNVKFDGFIASEIYGIDPALWVDTKGMSRAVHGRRIKNHSLANLALHYGLQPKGEMKTDGIKDLTDEQEKELSEYCLHDVELCRSIYEKLAKEFPENQYEFLDWSIRTFVKPRLYLDVDLLKKTHEKEVKQKDETFKQLDMNPAKFRSNPQFAEVLQTAGFSVPTKKSPRTGEEIPALAVGDEAFQSLLKSANPRLRTLCEARVIAKSNIMETRSAKLAAIGATGKWPFDIEYSGAMNTHRYSGGNGAGGNPQNFVQDSPLREAVIPPKGYDFIAGDLDKIECRFVAYLAKDEQLIEDLKEDPYCNFATEFYGREIIKGRDILERKFGKACILGLGYGMGWKKFQHVATLELGKPLEESAAKKAVYLYRSRYRGVPQLWTFLQQFIPYMTGHNSGRVLNTPLSFEHEAIILPDGLKLQYPDLHQEDKEWIYNGYIRGKQEFRKLYGAKLLENICQSLAGVLCKQAAAKFGTDCTGLVHDEVHLISPQDQTSSKVAELQRIMETSPEWMLNLQLKAEVKSGPNWRKCK